MKVIKVYQMDENNVFVGEYFADESPREPGVFLIPARCVELAPPQLGPGEIATYSDGKWTVSKIPEEVERAATLEEIKRQRQAAYRAESDNIKIEAEYDAQVNGAEPDYTVWLAKVAEIKARYPMPDQ